MAFDRVCLKEEKKRAWLAIDPRRHMYSVDAMNRRDGNPQVFFSPLFSLYIKNQTKGNQWQLFQCLSSGLEFLRLDNNEQKENKQKENN
jgi:hypothetical protein